MYGGRPHDRPKEPSLPAPKSTNNDPASLASTMKRLSLATAAGIELPPSSPIPIQLERTLSDTVPLSPAKLRRSPSANSLSSRSATPSLNRKTSLGSLKGTGGTSTPPRSPALRRQSSNYALSGQSGMTSKPLEPAVEEPPPPPITEASVAREFLQKDFESQKTLKAESDLVVIIHDACYGHRYSRPKTTKSNLNMIVERPERILATVLGISAAYIRLGGRHFGAHCMPHPGRSPESIPFRIQKSNRFVPLLSAPVTSVHGTKWMNELKIMCEGAEAKLATGGKELTRPSQITGDNSPGRPPLHEGDLYLCDESLNALEGALGGVLDAVDAVFDSSGPNCAFVAIRPPGHHCSDSYPSGFCWLNNVHVGISHAAAVHGLTHAAIIDFDLHHGDGSQEIAWEHNNRVANLPKNAPISKRTAIGYFSLHDINSYPCESGDPDKIKNASLCVENAHGQTIWNVHLQSWKTNAEFWDLYETRYSALLEKTRAFLLNQRDRLRASASAPQPRAAIFISAGFDASEWEGQGMQRHKVNVPTDFYARFTRDINRLADEEGLGVNKRVISVLEGGYSDRALTSGVLSHLCGMIREAEPAAEEVTAGGLSYDMVQRFGALKVEEEVQDRKPLQPDPSWWSPTSLEELENLVNPPPPAPPRKPKGPVNPTYTTPTQSFVAKVVPIARRSLSGTLAAAQRIPVVETPPPDVGWVTATHELSKILTPDRQTRSCKPEDLNAKATEIRRSRQSATGAVSPPPPPVDEGKRMQLRGRKGKAPMETDSRPASRSSRRTTIGGPDGTSDDGANTKSKPPRRRVSVASTIVSTAEEGAEMSQVQGQPESQRRRQSSSSAIRPSSAASNRVPAISEKPPPMPKPRVTKKPSTVPRPQVTRTASTSSQVSKAASAKSSDVEALTSGVKKMSIKLNVPPREEQEAREAKMKTARVPKKTQVGPKTTKKASRPSPATTNLPHVAEATPTVSQNLTTAPATQSAQSYGSVATLGLPSISEARQPPAAVPQPNLPSEPVLLEPAVPRESTIQPVLTASTNDNLVQEAQRDPDGNKYTFGKENVPIAYNMPPSFLPSNPEPIPAPTVGSSINTPANSLSLESSRNIPEMPPPTFEGSHPPSLEPTNVHSTPKRSKQDLPVFTSKSPIVFGPPKTTMVPGGMYQALAAEADDHPSSPGRLTQNSQEKKPSANKQSNDIWEVPDTPQYRLP